MSLRTCHSFIREQLNMAHFGFGRRTAKDVGPTEVLPEGFRWFVENSPFFALSYTMQAYKQWYTSHHLLCFPNKSVDVGNNNFSKFYVSLFQRQGFFIILNLCQYSNTSWFLEKQNGNTFGLYSILKLSSFINENISSLKGLNLEWNCVFMIDI